MSNKKRDVRVKVNGNTISNFSFSPMSGVVTTNINLEKWIQYYFCLGEK